MGGTRYPELYDLTRHIWEWCMKRGLWIFAEYVASKDNLADEGSRLLIIDTEWKLADYAFEDILAPFGPPSIDLFASRANTKCSRYCAWDKDPEAVAVNALTIPWTKEFWYAFPPFALLSRILKNVREEATTGILMPDPPAGPQPYPGCRSLIRQAYRRQGLTKDTLDVLVASLADNSIRQYNSALRYWWDFCQKHNHDPLTAREAVVVSCLTRRHKEGAAYGSVNTLRSAIALINGIDTSKSALIDRFFKGIFRLRPTESKYAVTWDVGLVLDLLETWGPNKELDLKKLTLKCCILLALGTAFRIQSLQLIKLESIKFKKHGIVITIKDLIKTSKASGNRPQATIPNFHKPTLCVARTVTDYVSRTQTIRAEDQQLLISWNPPHNAVGTQTISRWIREILSETGIQKEFTAHSTRHSSTSKAKAQGLDISIIKNAAGWSEASKVFNKFYNKPIVDQVNNFALSILNAQKQTQVDNYLGISLSTYRL
ncbi:uncharacterized protein LOC106644151 [Copidosoma floridanum]|uniref:uncharacterized protein LOC106644151 n=1 Tax=Copidosoma floridanum TaxID=29053 RepID=UPI0006C9CB94|nr:uncharacterized protein LOC106644151 [Copidosoma floridanum]